MDYNNNTENSVSIDDVLVVVDFQNGFIKGGSFGGHGNLKDLKFSVKQAKDIEKLIDANKTIIFTRDFHPINHLSIAVNGKVRANYSATWPSHCLNTKSICPRNKNALTNKGVNNGENYGINPGSLANRKFITISEYLAKPEYQNALKNISNLKANKFANDLKSYLEQPIIGTNISFLMYMTKYASEVLSLSSHNAPIGIPTETIKSGGPNFALINKNAFILNSAGKKFAQLIKGQLCRYESYSAFNYHWHIKLDRTLAEGKAAKGPIWKNANKTIPNVNKNGKQKVNNGLATYKSEYITKKYADSGELNQLSTGLFEFILSTGKNKINITVCGLVGEVCVINSVVEGLMMWRKYYQTLSDYARKKVIFNYSLKGTLFTGLGINHFEASLQPTNMNDFYNNMMDYLNDSNFVEPSFKPDILFNIFDTNGVFGKSVRYDTTSNNLELSDVKVVF
jgi:nicotinamidase-related amidase